jgi:hypothetical protein
MRVAEKLDWKGLNMICLAYDMQYSAMSGNTQLTLFYLKFSTQHLSFGPVTGMLKEVL